MTAIIARLKTTLQPKQKDDDAVLARMTRLKSDIKRPLTAKRPLFQ